MSEKESTRWCFNVMHLRRWWEITTHGAHTHTHMQRLSYTHLALGCVKSNLSKSLFWCHGAEDANTDDHRSHIHMRTLHACTLTHMQTHAFDAHVHTHTVQMHTLRGNPGRFISGGLQHSGCLSHFIGHRGRTGMGLFKSNPARPTHTYTHTCTHTHARMHTRFLFSGLTDARQSRWRGKEGGKEEGRQRKAGGRKKVKKKKKAIEYFWRDKERMIDTDQQMQKERESRAGSSPQIQRYHVHRQLDGWFILTLLKHKTRES